MIRSPSITSLIFTSSLFVAAALASPASAEDAPKTIRGQWPALEASKAKPGAAAAPAVKPAAAGLERRTPETLTPAGQLNALTGLEMSRDGKARTIKVPSKLKGMVLRGQNALGQAPKPGKLVPVKDTTQYPYTAVGLFSNGCSGALIGKRFVLTAAYCVFNPQNKQWEQNLDFYPGINGDSRPFDGVKWKNAWVTKGFADDGNWDLAFGLVELQSDVGDQNGWLGYGHYPEFPKGPVMTGYPAGVPDFTMWETTCPVKSAEKSYILYKCPLKKPLEGMAGAAIWIVDQQSNGPMVVALHGGPLKADLWGQRINEEAFYTLQSWIKDAESKDGEVSGGDTTGGDEVDPDDTQADEDDATQALKKQ